jgi:hypothetical protein
MSWWEGLGDKRRNDRTEEENDGIRRGVLGRGGEEYWKRGRGRGEESIIEQKKRRV